MSGAVGSMMMSAGAVVPGRVQNDAKHAFHIGRRYQVTNGDINKILRAAETYADKGYLYLLADITDPESPVIHVRVWDENRNNLMNYGEWVF